MSSAPDATQPGEAAYWDRIADEWRTRVRRTDEQIADFVNHLGCPPGSLILDAGCGAGTISVPLALQGYRVRGIDLAPRMIANASDFAREQCLSDDAAMFQVGDVEQLPFPDATFDAMICVRVLDFTPHPGVALTEFWRVLKPGARLLLLMLGAHSPVKREWWRRFLPGNADARSRNYILPWEMDTLLTELGWHIIAQHAVFGRTFDGTTTCYTAEMSDALGDSVLQQTVAGSWWFTAVRGT